MDHSAVGPTWIREVTQRDYSYPVRKSTPCRRSKGCSATKSSVLKMSLYLAHRRSTWTRCIVSHGTNLCSWLLIVNACLQFKPWRHPRSSNELACYRKGFGARMNDQHRSLFKYLSSQWAKNICCSDPSSLMCIKFNRLEHVFSTQGKFFDRRLLTFSQATEGCGSGRLRRRRVRFGAGLRRSGSGRHVFWLLPWDWSRRLDYLMLKAWKMFCSHELTEGKIAFPSRGTFYRHYSSWITGAGSTGLISYSLLQFQWILLRDITDQRARINRCCENMASIANKISLWYCHVRSVPWCEWVCVLIRLWQVTGTRPRKQIIKLSAWHTLAAL